MRDALEVARLQVSGLVNVAPRQVVFTSGAPRRSTRPSGALTRAAPGAPVLCAAVEHSAVRDASARAAPMEEIGVDGAGRLDVDALRERLGSSSLPRPALVHCQWANHEVGTLQPVHEVVGLCREAGVAVHVDAAAACGHVPTDLGTLDADLASVERPQAGRGARSRRPDRPAGGQVRTPPGRRRAGARAPGRTGADSGAPRLRCRGSGAGRRRAAPRRHRGGDGPEADRRRRRSGADHRRGRGRRARRAGGPAPPPRVPGCARRGGRAGADRSGPVGCGGPLGLRVLVGEHRALAGASGHGRRPGPLAAGQRGLDDDRRRLRRLRRRLRRASWPTSGPYGADVPAPVPPENADGTGTPAPR